MYALIDRTQRASPQNNNLKGGVDMVGVDQSQRMMSEEGQQ